jgi:arylformamidase
MANIDYNQILDVSIPLQEGMMTYPGNPKFTSEELTSSSGTNYVSRMIFGTHTGTHVDTPKHIREGSGIESFRNDAFIGPCRVLECAMAKGSIDLDLLKMKNIQPGERILLRTINSSRGFDEFYDDFVYLGSEAAEWLAQQGVALVGIDSLSIKQRGSDDNTPHTALLKKNIPIIERLNLKEAREGEYVLVASPLRITDADGAPARVLLLS